MSTLNLFRLSFMMAVFQVFLMTC